MIENQLERIAKALETLLEKMNEGLIVEPVTTELKTPEKKAPKAKAEKATKPAEINETTELTDKIPPQKAPEKPVEPPKEEPKLEPAKAPVNQQAPYTLETIRAQILAVQQLRGAPAAKSIVQTVGNAPQLSKIDPSKYDAVMAACQEAMANGQK